MEQSACRVRPNLRWPRNSAPPVRNRTRVRRLPRDFPELYALLANLLSQKSRALQSPSGSPGELPATPGCTDQYAIVGQNHHGARNGRTSDDSKLIARSRNCTDSLRCSTRRGYSIVRITQNRKDRRHERDPNHDMRFDWLSAGKEIFNLILNSDL